LKRLRGIIAITVLAMTLVGCSNGQATKEEITDSKEKKEIVISAAASLKESMEEIKKVYEEKNDVNLTFNLGASGSLQKQIEEGAPVDIFISAGEKQFQALEDKDIIESGSKRDIVENELALIVNNEYKDKIKSIDDLDNLDGYMALGEVGTVPVGQYAEEALSYYNKWNTVESKIVFAKDVKQVVSYVESEEAVCGVVYKSDAVHIKNSVVATTFDTSSHKKIIYPGGVIKTSEVKEEANKFLEFLNSNESKEIFDKYGFKVD
jgi:molybdate transport system substrate-binding protein